MWGGGLIEDLGGVINVVVMGIVFVFDEGFTSVTKRPVKYRGFIEKFRGEALFLIEVWEQGLLMRLWGGGGGY